MKVLLLSHNPVTTYNNMGKTFLSLFSAFRPEELCQLYLYPAVPDTACCGSYYRFTDREALHSIWDRHAVGGEISPDPACHDKFTSEKEERTYRSPRSRSEPMRLARDLIWQLSRWDHPVLKAWLDRERPDVLFVAPGKQELLYGIALTLARERHIPIVSYICDDFYFLQGQNAFWAKLRQKRLRRKIAALLQETALTVTICPELAARYHESFGAEVTDVMTCPPFAVHPYTEPGRDALHRCLTYMGNLGCGRGQPLLELGQTLDALNRQEGTDFTLEIYTDHKYPELLERLAACPAIRMHGFVTGKAYQAAFDGADAFVHVEAFDEENRDRVRYSVSTKIIESLASGRPLLAYGPEDVASMAYLRRNGCAALASSMQELPAAIEAVLTQEPYRWQLVERAAAVARREADNSARLHALLERVAAEGAK